MSSYDGQNLFGSGPHRFHVHGLLQRHHQHAQSGADGLRITTLGRSGRTIEQIGTLNADNVGELQQQTDAIEAVMDGRAAVLVDRLGRSWPNTMLLAFNPGPIRRIGLRLAADYEALYRQVNP